MSAYYNEIDKHAAAWLRELIKAGHIADGIVDERDIQDVLPSDLDGFTQCHFFAGIGVWSYALRKAGWPDDRPVWTGSAPCQPFSAAGKGSAFADERHLWPAFHHLIKECRPPVVFGEQVDAAIKSGWWDLAANDLEGIGYATAAIVFPASSVGAPHIRHRLYFVAECGAKSYKGIIAPHKKERNGNEGMQKMPFRKDAGSVLLGEEIGGRETILLQAVRQGPESQILDRTVDGAMGCQEGFEKKPRPERKGLLSPAQNDIQSEGPCLSCKAKSSQEGGSVRPGPARESVAEPDRCGSLRTDGDSVPTGRVEELRQPISGQDSPGTWVYVCKREDCLLCDELRAGNMGGGSFDCPDGLLEAEAGGINDGSINHIQAHSEEHNYAGREKDSGNKGVGAPHIRDRLYWVADSSGARLAQRKRIAGIPGRKTGADARQAAVGNGVCSVVWVADSDGRDAGAERQQCRREQRQQPQDDSHMRMAYSTGARHEQAGKHQCGPSQLSARSSEHGGMVRSAGPTNGFWRSADWLGCRDGKWRPVEPGLKPLVNGAAARVVRLRGYGNAINAVQAQAFVEAFMGYQKEAAA